MANNFRQFWPLSVLMIVSLVLPGPGHAAGPDLLPVENNPTDPKLAKIVLIAGSTYYKPGEHDYRANCQVLAKLLSQSPGVAPVLAIDWPTKAETLQNARTVVFLFDGGDKHAVLKGQRAQEIQKLLDQGVGLVQLHQAADYPNDFGQRAKDWAGGVFEKGYSQRAHWVDQFQEFPKHPVTRGVQPFKIDDGWLYRLRFVPKMAGITPILRTVDPKKPDQPRNEVSIVAWTYERPGGGRSFTFTGAHLHSSFAEEGYRRLLTNAILWTAGQEIPAQGAPVSLEGINLEAYLSARPAPAFQVQEDEQRIQIRGPVIEAAIRKKGYVSGVEARSFKDVATGFTDQGFGLAIVDWLMEPGSDEAYRDQLPGDLPYLFNNLVHGKRPKRSIEGPQICTQAKELSPRVISTPEFLAVTQNYKYHLAAPGKKTGSQWQQTLVFPAGKRYFFAADRVTSVNASDALFLRTDLPGHIKHNQGDSFREIYLSYHGVIPSTEFTKDFPPDEKFLYVRGEDPTPERMIRAYRIRDSRNGKDGPWLAGMTLDPNVVSEAWCHQRGYVCMIQEIGGRTVKPGNKFGAAYIIGFFDSIEEMHKVYDQYKGHSGLVVSQTNWRLTR